VRVLSVRDALALFSLLDATLARHRQLAPQQPPRLADWHRTVPWAYQLASTPSLIPHVELVLGGPCCIWASELWVKAPYSRMSVPWHQDHAFWPVPGVGAVSAWIALTEASADNGGLAFVPGSHRRAWSHVPMDANVGGLDAGVRAEDIAPEDVWVPTLSPGEAVLFDERTLHGSSINSSARPRAAYSVRYAPDPEPSAPRVPGSAPVLVGWASTDDQPALP
jgi:ectoine hydroxylase-related dioxygenase (phytanoyl-CoA dioxygenase family)